MLSKIPIRDYLGSILPGLADFPVRRVAALTPTKFRQSHPLNMRKPSNTSNDG
jgi:hypothetical protein